MRKIIFQKESLAEYEYWKKKDKRIGQRIKKLISSIQKDPFEGIGKPEPLKHNYKGYWSRRINKEHRLIYNVTDDAIIIIACRFHY